MPTGSGSHERAIAVEEQPEPVGSRIPAGRVVESGSVGPAEHDRQF